MHAPAASESDSVTGQSALANVVMGHVMRMHGLTIVGVYTPLAKQSRWVGANGTVGM